MTSPSRRTGSEKTAVNEVRKHREKGCPQAISVPDE